MTRMWTHLLPKPQRKPLLAAFLAVVLLAACGGDAKPAEEEKPAPRKAPAAAPAAGAEGAAASMEGWVLLGENAKWKPIKPLMDAYAQREIGGLHNPMRGTLVDFVERPMVAEPLEAPKKGEEKTGATSCVDPRNPATTGTLNTYTLFMLVTGVAQPKAVLTKQGSTEQLSVVRGDRLGSECGVVQAITQYQLVISVPGEPEKVMSLEPPLNPVEQLDAETQGNGKKPEL